MAKSKGGGRVVNFVWGHGNEGYNMRNHNLKKWFNSIKMLTLIRCFRHEKYMVLLISNLEQASFFY